MWRILIIINHHFYKINCTKNLLINVVLLKSDLFHFLYTIGSETKLKFNTPRDVRFARLYLYLISVRWFMRIISFWLNINNWCILCFQLILIYLRDDSIIFSSQISNFKKVITRNCSHLLSILSYLKVNKIGSIPNHKNI